MHFVGAMAYAKRKAPDALCPAASRVSVDPATGHKPLDARIGSSFTVVTQRHASEALCYLPSDLVTPTSPWSPSANPRRTPDGSGLSVI